MRLQLFGSFIFILPLLVDAQRFVRFISTDNKEYYGDAILPATTVDAAQSKEARVITGDILGDFTITNQLKVCFSLRLVSSRPLWLNNGPFGKHSLLRSFCLLFPMKE